MNFEAYTVNYDSVLQGPCSSVLRDMISTIKEQEYFSPGEYISKMSDDDLNEVITLAEAFESDVEAACQILLLAITAYSAEGGLLQSEEEGRRISSAFVAFIVSEKLKRNGAADCIYENWTLFEEGMDAEILKLRGDPGDMMDML